MFDLSGCCAISTPSSTTAKSIVFDFFYWVGATFLSVHLRKITRISTKIMDLFKAVSAFASALVFFLFSFILGRG